ncbi:hypothetical protein DIPPA_27668 [Diplonema papillatum]|nr:hypothetical protein DIPPA_06341 [Diplonema papillatum]KAJ9440244.1 hypothetical protein DIPPA_00146 [Diplonema papillatum]KAJ9445051.1 hypothetical protein DIPPA_27668 [Diplonema papillatum]
MLVLESQLETNRHAFNDEVGLGDGRIFHVWGGKDRTCWWDAFEDGTSGKKGHKRAAETQRMEVGVHQGRESVHETSQSEMRRVQTSASVGSALLPRHTTRQGTASP